MKKGMLITTILLAFLTVATSITMAEDPSERDALIALFNSTNGVGWINKAGWNTVDPYCTWFGVYCYENSVIELDLTGNQLSGPIPAELGNLSNLDELDLVANQLSGPIPPELGNLNNLRWLSLSDNQLSGPIPASLGDLSNLEGLHLRSNQLNGPIPAALSNLSKLYELGLFNNPDLKCWQTKEALVWAQNINWYEGPNTVCPSVYLPGLISSAN